MHNNVSHYLMVASLTLALGACGSNPKERGLSGGAIGAGTGAVIGAVTGMSVLQGVAIGTGLGAVVGAVTTRDQINLGSLDTGAGQKSSTAHNTSSNAGLSVTPVASPLIKDVQAALHQAGYDPGPVDGFVGPRTRRAIGAYQSSNGLSPDGQPSAELLQHLLTRRT